MRIMAGLVLSIGRAKSKLHFRQLVNIRAIELSASLAAVALGARINFQSVTETSDPGMAALCSVGLSGRGFNIVAELVIYCIIRIELSF